MCIKILPACLMPRHPSAPAPAALIVAALKLIFRKQLVFEPQIKGIVVIDDGVAFRPFRKAIVDENRVQSRFPVLFKVRFVFKNLPFRLNRLLSWIPVPLIAAQRGFISKTWYQRPDANAFMGIYEFNSLQSAKDYWHSLPLQMMKCRARADSLRGEVITFDVRQGRYVREILE